MSAQDPTSNIVLESRAEGLCQACTRRCVGSITLGGGPRRELDGYVDVFIILRVAYRRLLLPAPANGGIRATEVRAACGRNGSRFIRPCGPLSRPIPNVPELVHPCKRLASPLPP
jgi:hypothetical protein